VLPTSAPSQISSLDRYRCYLSRLATVPLQTKLGCHFECVYCTYGKIEGGQYRLYSPKSVADAVQRSAARGLRDIEIVDNVFNSPHEHAMEICAELARAGHNARLQSLELNPLFVDDALLTAMERQGSLPSALPRKAPDTVLQGLRKGFRSGRCITPPGSYAAIRWHASGSSCSAAPEKPKKPWRRPCASSKTCPSLTRFSTPVSGSIPAPNGKHCAGTGSLSTTTDMLAPVFSVTRGRCPLVGKADPGFQKKHMNVLGSDSLVLPFLPALHRVGYRLGIRSIWRHTSKVRRGLKYLGIYT
jgi:hypothetical protein